VFSVKLGIVVLDRDALNVVRAVVDDALVGFDLNLVLAHKVLDLVLDVSDAVDRVGVDDGLLRALDVTSVGALLGCAQAFSKITAEARIMLSRSLSTRK